MPRKKDPGVKLPTVTQLPSGNYRVRIMLEGTSHSIVKSTPEECIAEYVALKHKIMDPKPQQERRVKTLREAVSEHIDSLRDYRSPSTIYGYEKDARNTFQMAMGWNVYTTTDEQWQSAIKAERKMGRSSHYIKNAWGLMGASIESVTGRRPSVILYPPESEVRAWLDPDEIDKLVAALKGHMIEIPALLCLSSLRRSEMLGLKWSQIDLKRKTITVSGARVRGTDGVVDKKQNKTQKSKRTVPIIPPLLEALQSVDEQNGNVVTVSGDTVLKYVHILCRESGITDVDLHGLRHSFASLCYHLQIPEMICAEIGGWDDLGTMHKIYTHLSQKDIAKRSQDFSNFFDPAKRS